MSKILYILLFFISTLSASAQDLMDILEEETPPQTNLVESTFKGTRIINGHSIENRKQGVLEFLISHRFGRINDGFDELFGLDQSNIRFALEYALNDDLTFGLGRSSFEKTLDGFAKFRVLKQTAGASTMPLSISLFGSVARKTIKNYAPDKKPDFSDRLYYTSQVLIARKFSDEFSFQLTPTYIHKNSVQKSVDPHDIFALGTGARMKLSKRLSLNAEYFYTINPLKSINPQNSFAVSVDIETGGHVFQLILSNAITMVENSFITETTDHFFKGDVHFGFNISRAFQVSHKHKN